MAATKMPRAPLFGRVPDAREAVRDVSNDLIATIKAMRSGGLPQHARPLGRHDFPMRLLAAVVQAHVSTDCVVGHAIPVPPILEESTDSGF